MGITLSCDLLEILSYPSASKQDNLWFFVMEFTKI